MTHRDEDKKEMSVTLPDSHGHCSTPLFTCTSGSFLKVTCDVESDEVSQ